MGRGGGAEGLQRGHGGILDGSQRKKETKKDPRPAVNVRRRDGGRKKRG